MVDIRVEKIWYGGVQNGIVLMNTLHSLPILLYNGYMHTQAAGPMYTLEFFTQALIYAQRGLSP